MITISPSYRRCLVFTLVYLTTVFLVPVWLFAWYMGELTAVGLLALGFLTLLVVTVFIPIFALFMASLFQVAFDAERLTSEAFSGVLSREIRFEDVKAVRCIVFMYAVSCRAWFREILLPAPFLMDRETRQNLADHLRRVLPPGNPLLRLAR